MSYLDLVNTVVAATSRSDQLTLIQAYVKQAIQSLHSKGDFSQDRRNAILSTSAPIVQPTGPFGEWEIDVTQLTDYRSIYELIEIDLTGKAISRPYVETKMSTRMYEKAVGMDQGNPRYCKEGTKIRVLDSINPSSANWLLSYQSRLIKLTEDLATGDFTTWITETYPHIITEYVTFQIHNKNGNSAKAKTHYALFELAYPELITEN